MINGCANGVFGLKGDTLADEILLRCLKIELFGSFV